MQRLSSSKSIPLLAEISSRLAFRLDRRDQDRLLKCACEMYTQTVAGISNLASESNVLFERLLSNQEFDLVLSHLSTLLQLPIAGETKQGILAPEDPFV